MKLLLETLKKPYGLEFKNCRGQGYDGASNISAPGDVQGRLIAENPKAIYMHCNAHILNHCLMLV